MENLKETISNKLEEVSDFCDEHYALVLAGISAAGYIGLNFLAKNYFKGLRSDYQAALMVEVLKKD